MREFLIRVTCDYPQWWRYNLYMIAVAFDEKGERIDYHSFTDRVYEPSEDLTRQRPADYPSPRIAEIRTSPCDHCEFYFYAVANTFPASPVIRDSPPFEATLEISSGDEILERKTLEVNQWGGCTLVAYPIGN